MKKMHLPPTAITNCIEISWEMCSLWATLPLVSINCLYIFRKLGCSWAFHNTPSLPPALTSFLLPIPQCSQGLWGDGTYVLFIVEQKSLIFITYSHYFYQLHVSVVIHPHCKRKSLWPVLRGTLIYGHKHNYLEDNLIVTLWKFTRIHYLGSCRAHDFPSHEFWPGLQCQMSIPSLEAGLKSNQKMFIQPINTKF